MKIGIMTYWWSKDNYGQQLQCYALQKYLQNAGHDAYLIRYDMPNEYIFTTPPSHKPLWRRVVSNLNPIKWRKYILRKRRMAVLAQENKKNDERKFNEFQGSYIKQSEKIYHQYKELKENPPEADIYIVGSDQVWNPDYVFWAETHTRAYFLDFGNPSVKKISYAASFGKEKLDDNFMQLISPLLQKFNYVSVREKSGLDICNQCGIDNADWVPDPTMLLGANAYRALYKNEAPIKAEKRYCFLYFLSNQCDFSLDTVYAWAKEKGLDVVYISANSQRDQYEKKYATIPEWIYLLEHAEYVITNSYHCCVFALIFEKKLGVIPLSESCKGMNDRFDSLFELFKIEKRFFHNADFSVLDMDIDWKTVSGIFQGIGSNCKLLDLDKL